MKTPIRLFFRGVRTVLGPVMLLKESLTRPKGLVRSPEQQQAVDVACRDLALYQYRTCPFCIKVRQETRRLALNMSFVDAQYPGPARSELTAGGGQAKVPCLRIANTDGTHRWLYDSTQIISYLRERFQTA
ncbi:MAG: glutaredoxin family protein [Giesbergeria sp.]